MEKFHNLLMKTCVFNWSIQRESAFRKCKNKIYVGECTCKFETSHAGFTISLLMTRIELLEFFKRPLLKFVVTWQLWRV